LAGAAAWGAGAATGFLSAQANNVAEDANNSVTTAALVLPDEVTLQYLLMFIIFSSLSGKNRSRLLDALFHFSCVASMNPKSG
jgi:hypothetical protein